MYTLSYNYMVEKTGMLKFFFGLISGASASFGVKCPFIHYLCRKFSVAFLKRDRKVAKALAVLGQLGLRTQT